MANSFPSAYILLTIREQISFLESAYKHHIYNYGFQGNFEKRLNYKGVNYLGIGLYSNIYKTINTYFPPENINILFYEQLKLDHNSYFGNIYSILGIEPPKTIINEKHNVGVVDCDIHQQVNKRKESNQYLKIESEIIKSNRELENILLVGDKLIDYGYML